MATRCAFLDLMLLNSRKQCDAFGKHCDFDHFPFRDHYRLRCRERPQVQNDGGNGAPAKKHDFNIGITGGSRSAHG
jgi:hypothetical protein